MRGKLEAVASVSRFTLRPRISTKGSVKKNQTHELIKKEIKENELTSYH